MLCGRWYNQNGSGWHMIKFWTSVCTPLPGSFNVWDYFSQRHQIVILFIDGSTFIQVPLDIG